MAVRQRSAVVPAVQLEKVAAKKGALDFGDQDGVFHM
jgi:hypothetical protein